MAKAATWPWSNGPPVEGGEGRGGLAEELTDGVAGELRLAASAIYDARYEVRS